MIAHLTKMRDLPVIAASARIRSAGSLALAALALSCGPGDSPPPAAAIPSPSPPPTIKIAGEARVLWNTSPVALSHPVQSVKAVYSFNSAGERVEYVQGSDWQLTASGVARTSGSRIPDFSTYTYTREVGDRFSFSSEPRNPPLTITYNVYIDYVSPRADPFVTALPLGGPSNSVLCLGDSIAAGAHTIEQFYRENDSQSWCGLLRTFLGPEAEVSNSSVGGGQLQTIHENLMNYTMIPADTVILAFGINDHVFEPEGGVSTFALELDEVVHAFASRGSNVLLVGFFQQNSLWLLEDPDKTIAYNQAIKSVAEARGIPFIDVYTAFEGARPVADPPFLHLTADFMHHPNVYGQRIYYSLLVPYFLQSSRPASEIPNYVVGPWTQ